ncbi:MAG: cytochrome P450 [Gammaproteobacteria bacterium]|nr:cytochrome P450 [Gammaproteobacteria bacterium]
MFAKAKDCDFVTSNFSISHATEDEIFLPFRYIILGLIGLLVYYLYRHFIGSRKNLPPGPTPLPVVGNLLLLEQKRPHLAFIELSKKYGSVFTF